MIKLYGFGQTRSARCVWTLQELGLAFEFVKIQLSKGEHFQSEYQQLQPFSRVPVLQDGDLTLYESAAICCYLADHYGEAHSLIPAPGSRERILHDQWLSFVISSFEQPLDRIVRHLWTYPEASRSSAEIALAKQDFYSYCQTLEKLITPVLVGDRFSVADILLCYVLKWSTLWDLLADFPRLQGYLANHMERPAFPRELYKV
ncbi:MAG: glutathione S-transferase family protein [Candidatus Sericytochromatia bacterium]|nr:glutathione S-transferase family protein [Candidatus Sericytochromatia bacterium]